VKKTPLNEEHKKLNGKMVNFLGWELPVQYSGVIEEHNTVRTKAGIFDVSHMGEITVKGDDALKFINYMTSNDVSKLSHNQIHYSTFTTEKGTVVDDLLCYRKGDNDFLLVVNAANIEKDFNWLKSHSKSFSVELEDISDSIAQMAIQGPNAVKIMSDIFGEIATDMKYYWFDYVTYKGEEVLLSRTGYTGEDGFEVYISPKNAPSLWNEILEKGKPYGLIPCGLGARDSLRLEAKMCLYGNDMDETTTVLEAGLGWITKLDKEDFLGKDVLLKQKEEGLKRRLVGFEMVDRGIARHGYPVFLNKEDEKEAGKVCSGSFAPYLEKNIGLTYMPKGYGKVGTEFFIGIRKKRLKAVVVKTPFYKREK
jgi:aminomethyltransferase